MKVSDAVTASHEFVRIAGAFSLSIHFSEAWRPKDRISARVPQENSVGIYLFSDPAGLEGNFSAESNAGEVWYIGASNENLGSRVWSHLGRVYDPSTGIQFDPPFKGHRWRSVTGAAEHVLHTVATGNVIIYTASIEPKGSSPGWCHVLEKHLLIQSYLMDQRLPALNLSM